MMTKKFTPPSVQVTVEIPFHDVDSVHAAWHGHYAKYLEIARCELLESIDYNYPQMRDSGYVWPVIEMKIRYVQMARFQQKLRITATLAEWENRLLIKYLIQDAETGCRITKASTVQVAVRMDNGEMLLASPSVLLQKLELE